MVKERERAEDAKRRRPSGGVCEMSGLAIPGIPGLIPMAVESFDNGQPELLETEVLCQATCHGCMHAVVITCTVCSDLLPPSFRSRRSLV